MPPMIAAANVAPNFLLYPKITADDLKRLSEPVVFPEYHGFDADGESFYAFTVGGWLDGRQIARATVGGDVIILHADSQTAANYMAVLGLEATIEELLDEDRKHLDALAAQARLKTVGALERLDLAIKPDAEKSPAFERDMAKVRTLVGDDLILSQGH